MTDAASRALRHAYSDDMMQGVFLEEARISVPDQDNQDSDLVVSDSGATPSICRKYAARDERLHYVWHGQIAEPRGITTTSATLSAEVSQVGGERRRPRFDVLT